MQPAHLLVDGLIILVYFGAITAIGLYMGRREDSLEDFALGGRRVPWWAVMASIIAAETSAATFIGAPAEGYARRGVTYVQLTVGLILGRVLVGQIFLKPYYTYRVYTVYDFLAIRFGPLSKGYVSALFLIMRTLASGVRLFVPSLIMVLAWRLFALGQDVRYGHLDTVQPYLWAILILTVVTCVYTAMGGIKAVIWTDVIQATLMFGSAILALFTLLAAIGGGSLLEGLRAVPRHVPEMATTRGYFLTGFEDAAGLSFGQLLRRLLESPYTLPAALIAATVSNMAVFGTDQDMVQRMLTAKDYRRSRRSLVTAALLDVPIALTFTLIGVLLIAFYDQHPALRPGKPNDVFGAYILGVMPVGVRGLVLAGVFATAMGSLSAALNALATSMTNDWYAPYLAPGRPARHYVAAARAFTALFALLMIAIAVGFAYLSVKDPALTILPIALGVAGYLLGPMLGVFLVGMLTRARGSDRGNVIAVTVGLVAVVLASGRYLDLLALLGAAARRPAWLPRVEFTWYALIGATGTFCTALLFRTPPLVVAAAAARAREGALR